MALLFPHFWNLGRACELIVVAEFNHSVVPLAWLLSRLTGAALVFDPAVSYFDEMVITQAASSAGSLRGRYLYFLDALAFRLSDYVLWYMPADCDYFAGLFPSLRGKQGWSPPAIDEDLFTPLPPKLDSRQFVVHFNSSYLPTHGVDVILQAAKLLNNDRDIVFDLVGNGPTYAASVALANSLGLKNVTFRDTLPAAELPKAYKDADVCLGAFRDDAKLARLIELKIISALASRRPVIAADSPLKREFFRPNEDIVLVPPGNPVALADAIRRLRSDSASRLRLAESGLRAVHEHFSLELTGLRMTSLLTSVMDKRRRRPVVGQKPHRPL